MLSISFSSARLFCSISAWFMYPREDLVRTSTAPCRESKTASVVLFTSTGAVSLICLLRVGVLLLTVALCPCPKDLCTKTVDVGVVSL